MRISDWSSDVGASDLKTQTPAEAKAEETEDSIDTEADANEEDTHTEDDDTLDTGDESVDEEETPKPKKKNRFQERIDEVVGKHRETERKLEEALAENARIDRKSTRLNSRH